MAGLYFEEFEVGREFHHEFSRTVTEMDNTMFSLLTMNPQPLHIDAHFAEKTEFGQRLFNSLYTLGIMIGMSVDMQRLRIYRQQAEHRVVHLGDGPAEFMMEFAADLEFLEI